MGIFWMKNKVFKITIAVLGAIVLFVIFTVVTIVSSGVVQTYIKRVIVNELQNTFVYPTVVGSVEGNLVTGVEINNLVIGNDNNQGVAKELLRAEKIVVNYNFLNLLTGNKLIKKRLDITVVNPSINIEHYRDDTFNVLKALIKQPEQKGQTFPYHIIAHIRGGTVSYLDFRGFSSSPLNKPVLNKAKNVTAQVVFDGKNAKILTEGKLNDLLGYKPFKILGNINTKTNKFSLDVDARKVDFAKWGNYVVPIDGLKFVSGLGNVSIKLSDKKESTTKDNLPFTIAIAIKARDVSLKVPWIKPQIQDAKGLIEVTNDGVIFREVKGIAAGNAFGMEGNLHNFQKLKTDLTIKSDSFDISHSKEFYPFLEKWRLLGKASLAIAVKSEDEVVPIVSGTITVPSGNVYSHPLSGVLANFNLKNSKLYFAVDKSEFYRGDLQVSADVDLIPKVPVIAARGHVSHLDVKTLFKGSNYIQGVADADFVVDGVPDNLDIKTEIHPVNVLFLGQPLKKGTVLTKSLDGVLDFYDAMFVTHYDDIIAGNGKLFANRSFVANLKLNNVYFNNVNLRNGKPGLIAGSLSGEAAIKGIWNDYLTKDPLHWLTVSGKLTVANLNLQGQKIERIDSSVDIVNDTLSLNNIKATDKESTVVSDLVFDKHGLISGGVKGRAFDIQKLNIIKSYLPENFRDVQGITDFQAKLMRKLPRETAAGAKYFTMIEAVGDVNVRSAYYNGQPVKLFRMDYSWDGKTFSMNNVKIQENYSSVEGSGFVNLNKVFNFRFKSSYFVLDEIKQLTRKIGEIGGNGSGEGEVYGTIPSWDIKAKFDISAFRYNSIIFDRTKGEITKKGKNFTVSPLLVTYRKNNYNVIGDFVLSTPFIYDLSFDVQKGDIKDIAVLVNKIKTEYQKRGQQEVATEGTQNVIELDQYLEIAQPTELKDTVLLYSSNDNQENIISSFNEYKEIAKKPLNEELGFQENFGGIVSGKLNVSNKTGELRVNADIEIDKGHVSSISFNHLKSQISTKENQINVAILVREGLIGDANYDQIDGEFIVDSKRTLNINKFSMAAMGQSPRQVITGKIPLGEFLGEKNYGEIDINVSLNQDDINLLSIFNKNIKWLKNDGYVGLHIGGTLRRPFINAKEIKIINGEIKLADDLFIKSPLQITKADISLKNNIIMLNEFNVRWRGKDTNGNTNQFEGYGKLSFQDLTFLRPQDIVLDFDVSMKDTKVKINFPELYIGEMNISNATFKGPLILPLSKRAKNEAAARITNENEVGPVLKADLSMFNGEIPLPDNGKRNLKPSILLNARTYISKDVRISGGDFAKGAISSLVNNIDIYLKENKNPLLIKGSLNTVIIDGNLEFQSGEIVFLNKSFLLMDQAQQEKYFEKGNIKRNNVEFVSEFDEEQNRRRVKPVFHMVAITDVDRTEVEVTANESIDTQPTSKQNEPYSMIFMLDGSVMDPMGMSLYFYKDTAPSPELEPGYPYVIGKLTYEQLQEITRYLFPVLDPKFYEELFTSGFEGAKTKQVLSSISEMQINTLLARQLRPLERELAENIGLYDLKFNYNLGKNLNKAIFGKTDTAPEEKDTATGVGVDFAFKLFFDRLFVKIKTQLDQVKTTDDVVKEYELTLAILEWLSLNYNNRLILNENGTYRGGYSLEAQYGF